MLVEIIEQVENLQLSENYKRTQPGEPINSKPKERGEGCVGHVIGWVTICHKETTLKDSRTWETNYSRQSKPKI